MANQSDPKASPLQDFLEKYVADGFKRELDLEEAVWRTVPAFVTALGLLGAAAFYLFNELLTSWNLERDWPVAGVLALALVAMSLAAWQLRFAVKTRRHRYPPDEVEICTWSTCLRAAARATDVDPSQGELDVLREVRAKVLSEVAEAASCNHKLNVEKLAGRTRSARWLFVAAVLMLLSGVTQALTGHLSRQGTANEQRERAAAASAPAAAAAHPGASAPVGREGQHDNTQVPVSTEPPATAPGGVVAPPK